MGTDIHHPLPPPNYLDPDPNKILIYIYIFLYKNVEKKRETRNFRDLFNKPKRKERRCFNLRKKFLQKGCSVERNTVQTDRRRREGVLLHGKDNAEGEGFESPRVSMLYGFKQSTLIFIPCLLHVMADRPPTGTGRDSTQERDPRSGGILPQTFILHISTP